ncbi:ABC transporter ATP-binding protein [Pectinatus haikarae]|uniref:Iron complex transport system ATP-binding protein n=1 Tax=Pectinatus haikarae TaxID=349096 RepID=A0ABT9YA60_9FIRM|nr:ABC transporter ATP-binding protein [Pectinatus haikarae]MDQ0204727.1 iron complex transport system ATP-binding protein [Pectinatus haikarae]
MDISVKNISFSIKNTVILSDISASIASMECVGIVGPNGSGKSTLLKCIYRVLQPDAGEIFFDGSNIKNMTLKESARAVSVMAQDNSYAFDFLVEDIVLLGRTPYKKMLQFDNEADYKIVKNALKTVGLAGFEKRNFSAISGGEKQRVILARALAQNTSCLIMDEPTNHLDIKYQMQTMEIVKKHKFTSIIAIHDLNIAALYCDRIIALKDGQIVGNDVPEKLLTPEFIYYLYEVLSEVHMNKKTGKVNIIYMPSDSNICK